MKKVKGEMVYKYKFWAILSNFRAMFNKPVLGLSVVMKLGRSCCNENG